MIETAEDTLDNALADLLTLRQQLDDIIASLSNKLNELEDYTFEDPFDADYRDTLDVGC